MDAIFYAVKNEQTFSSWSHLLAGASEYMENRFPSVSAISIRTRDVPNSRFFLPSVFSLLFVLS